MRCPSWSRNLVVLLCFEPSVLRNCRPSPHPLSSPIQRLLCSRPALALLSPIRCLLGLLGLPLRLSAPVVIRQRECIVCQPCSSYNLHVQFSTRACTQHFGESESSSQAPPISTEQCPVLVDSGTSVQPAQHLIFLPALSSCHANRLHSSHTALQVWVRMPLAPYMLRRHTC